MNPADLMVAPHSIESEQSLIGALLLDATTWDRVADIVTPEDCYRDDHRVIVQHIGALMAQNRPVDVVTLYDSLERAGVAERVGGLSYLGEIANATPSAANARRYAEIIREFAIRRALMAAGQRVVGLALEATDLTIEQRVAEASACLAAVEDAGVRQGSGPIDAMTAVSRALEQIDARVAGTGHRRYQTGLERLDERLYSYVPGALVVVAGRPGMGKTSLAMQCAETAAFDDSRQGAVAVFSLEMQSPELIHRSIARIGRLPLTSVIEGSLSEDQWHMVSMATGKLANSPLVVDDSPALHINQIRARCNAIRRKYGLRLVVVDYIQLVRGDGENRTQQIGSVSRGLKAVAKESGCPVVALSQLNRKVEDRPNKRPGMADIRESGDIEQDADLILFCYRDEVYNPDSPDVGTAEIIIGKQRNGPAGDHVRVAWHGQYASFANLDEAAWHEQRRAAEEQAEREKPMRHQKRVGFRD